MTYKEANNFYQMDEKKYYITKNIEFIEWISREVKNGYNCSLTYEQMQKLVDFLVDWYEIKYPNHYFDLKCGIYDDTIKDNQELSKNMNFEAFLYRLPLDILQLFRNHYVRYITIPYKENKERTVPYLLLFFDPVKGIVTNKMELEDLGLDNIQDLTMENLYNILRKKYKDLDTSEIKKCLNNRIVNFELLRKLLELSSLKMLYSNNTIPHYGYDRAKIFIDEFNEYLDNLNLDTFELDSIMQKDYSNTINETNISSNNTRIFLKRLRSR